MGLSSITILLKDSTQEERIKMCKILEKHNESISKTTLVRNAKYNWRSFSRMGENWCGIDYGKTREITIHEFIRLYGTPQISLKKLYGE